MSRQKLNLLILVVLLGAALVYAFQMYPRQQRVVKTSGGKRQPGRSARLTPEPQGSVAELSLDFGSGKRHAYRKPKRDLFSPLVEEVKPVPPPVVVQPPPPEPTVVEPVAPPPPPPVAQTRPMPRFALLGYLQKKEQQTVFLAAQGEIYLVRRGESFGDGFLVRELTEEKLVIGRTADAGVVTIPLVEPKSARKPTPLKETSQPPSQERPRPSVEHDYAVPLRVPAQLRRSAQPQGHE